MTTSAPCLRWSVGEVEVLRVEEAVTPVPPELLVPDLSPIEIDERRGWAEPYVTGSGLLLLSVHTFVLRHRERVVVVDTCVGVGSDHPLPSDPTFPDRLAAEIDGGLAAVDTVLCTHLHFDHVGWNLLADPSVPGGVRPTFPRARYLFGRRELETLDDDVRGSVQPLLDAGVVDLIDAGREHVLVDDDAGRIWTVPTPGHTPGHVSVMIESSGARALITGDVFHTPLQIALPQRHASFDDDPVEATLTRARVIDLTADEEVLMLGTHFAPPTAGHVRRADGEARFVAFPGR